MKEVLPKTLSNPTDSTIVTVINAFLVIVIPELAYATIVPRSPFTAVQAYFSSWLTPPAKHTEHVLGFSSVQRVIFHLIMTKSTGVPATAGRAL